jgi:tetratricopeptide (TPR) repeat protein
MGLIFTLPVAIHAHAQGTSAAVEGRDPILLVLPFDNRTGQPSLEWIREASAEILSSRLASAGFAPMSRAERIFALDHLGLPQDFHPSRATSLKLATTLDADSIIVGNYVTDGSGIVAEAWLVDVPHLRMSPPVTARGEMHNLIPVFNSLAWKLTRQLDPSFSGSEETFANAGSSLRLSAFEQYTRGITEPDHDERLRHLSSAVALSPEFSQAWLALGREQYAAQQYEQAAQAFARVNHNDADALEADFYRGLSLLFNGDYAHAEEAFAAVARVLPLAEVLNNQGVALARSAKDGIPLFRQAIAADSSGADYHFNLAVSLKRHGDTAEALSELVECLKLRPNDPEALTIQRAWMGKSAEPMVKPAIEPTAIDGNALAEEATAKPDPLERIMRSFNAVAFHQAALMLDQMNAAKLAAMQPHQRAEKLAAQAENYLERGMLLEAERIDLTALATDNSCAAAHAGLAEVRERTSDTETARKEATRSLELQPSVDAYLVLGRLNFGRGHFDEARQNADAALKIDPTSKPAIELQQKIQAAGQKR